MYVVWGHDLYGTVDQVPGVCEVRTRFPHFMYIPLRPWDTFLTVAGTDVAYPIRRSWKSIGYTYLRFALILISLIATGCWVDQLIDPRRHQALNDRLYFGLEIAIAIGAIGLNLASFRLSRAKPDRAAYLLKLVERVREREQEESEKVQEPAKPWHRPVEYNEQG